MQTQQVKGLVTTTSNSNIYTSMPKSGAPVPLPRDTDKSSNKSPTIYGSMPTEPEEQTISVNDKNITSQPAPNPNNTYGSMKKKENPYQKTIREDEQQPPKITTTTGNIYTNPSLVKPPAPQPDNTYTSAKKIDAPIEEQYQEMPTKPGNKTERPKNPHAHLYQKTMPERKLIADKDSQTPEEEKKKQEEMKKKKKEWYQSVLDPRLVGSENQKEAPKKPAWNTTGPKTTEQQPDNNPGQINNGHN